MMRLKIEDKHKDRDHCLKLKLPREKDPSPTHYANHTYGGAKIKFGFV
jgi:hypothetical protein